MDMDYVQRTPKFRVVISRPRYDSAIYSEQVISVFSSDTSNIALRGYNYEMNLSAFDCPFSLMFVPAILNGSSETAIDIIRLNDIVKIEEHGVLSYVGIVNSRRYAARMSESGPDRSIIIQGYGIGAILDRFQMLLDLVVLSSSVATLEAIKIKTQTLLNTLSSEYDPNTSMVGVLEKIRDSFKSVMEVIGEYPAGTGMFSLIDKYLQFGKNVYGDEMDARTKYPISLSIFTYGAVTLGEAWRQLVVKPFYEMFTQWDAKAGTWIIVVRPTPYSPQSWASLPVKALNPLHVTSLDVGFSSEDVKTYFFAYLSGGTLGYEQARAMYQQTAIKKDSVKWALYGYRPLEASFRYANQVRLSEDRNIDLTKAGTGDPNTGFETINDATLMGRYSALLQKWFGRADEMLSGSIEVMTMKDGPSIGERVTYDGIEFYVESLSRSWQYEGRMVTTLQVTRGGKYNRNYRPGTGPEGEDIEDASNWWFQESKKIGTRFEPRGSVAR